ncbi:MAG TPA: membrane spanning transport protein [Thermoanaerobaculia bacterium]|nr:membrane spanning transport protein [Thermoanaerobaculia bacterium]HPA53057.1 membrane spanning transport protein [Thermoanaerobaculia bacterium]HQN09635.1 membrane spanning transport protein [Thermoanaerobaculia bacterium]HQP86124.1 membrane spanning transport protein [Thermoanaerobaculia bacterium]
MSGGRGGKDSTAEARAITVARLVLGTLFASTGLCGLLGLLPLAPPHAFQQILLDSGWMVFVKLVELAAGLLLLSNRFVPLALALLAPVVGSIALYHLLLDPAFLWLVPLVVGLEGFLLWAYRGSFRGVLARDARPGG